MGTLNRLLCGLLALLLVFAGLTLPSVPVAAGQVAKTELGEAGRPADPLGSVRDGHATRGEVDTLATCQDLPELHDGLAIVESLRTAEDAPGGPLNRPGAVPRTCVRCLDPRPADTEAKRSSGDAPLHRETTEQQRQHASRPPPIAV